jgi:Kef-type K+ transport system membrane component KefB
MKKLFDKVFPFLIICLFLLLILTVIRTSVFGQVEEDKHVYFEIVFLLLLAVLGEIAVTYLKQPSVMILMVLGILMSPSFLSLSFSHLGISLTPPNILRFDEVIHVFAQIGAIVLLFKVGLHSKIETVFSRKNMFVATAGVILPFVAGYIYASITGGDFAYSMFLGAALTATSVGVTVALLKEMNLLKERFAQVIIGAAIIDDVLGLLVLSFVLNVSGGADSFMPLLQTFASAAVFLVGGIFAGNYFLNYLDRKEMSSRRLMAVLAFMLFYSYVAEFIQLSAIVGAFISGLIISRSRHIKQIEDSTYGLEILFVPIFFITLGMLVDVDSLYVYSLAIIVITAIAVLSKVIACSLAAYASKLNSKESLLVGVGMAPRGEVALIIAAIGLTKGVLDVSQYSIISAMALLTTFLVPPILGYLLKNKK